MTQRESITTIIELDEEEEAIILSMFEFMENQKVMPNELLDCDCQAYYDLRGRLKG